MKLRTSVTRAQERRKPRVSMACKLLHAAQERSRRRKRHELVSHVLAGLKFKDGIKITNEEMTAESVAA